MATKDDAAEQIKAAFGRNERVEMFMYEGVKHGFDFGPPHPKYIHHAAKLCDTRVALFFNRMLERHVAAAHDARVELA